MLFDLTGRGRRRTVRVIYGGLALLFLVGFVGFGVGTGAVGGGGGLSEIFGEGKSGGEVDYSKQVKKAQQLTVQQPNNPAAWSGLIHYLLLQAGTGQNLVSNGSESAFTAKAKPLLTQAQDAWQRYLKLTPHPSAEVAAEALRIYGTPGGIENPKEIEKALKIEVAAQPASFAPYYHLAEAAYVANDVKEGDRAAKKALALAPAGEKTILQNYLAKAKSVGAAKAQGIKTNGRTITIPASKLPKGAKGGGTVTLPASSLPAGVTTGATSGTLNTPNGAATTPAPASTAPKK